MILADSVLFVENFKIQKKKNEIKLFQNAAWSVGFHRRFGRGNYAIFYNNIIVTLYICYANFKHIIYIRIQLIQRNYYCSKGVYICFDCFQGVNFKMNYEVKK